MWKRLISLILCVTILFGTVSPAFADGNGITLPDVPVPAGEKDVGAAVSPMKKGDKAPFTGVLLSPTAVATIIAQIHAADAQIKIEVDKAKAEARAQCDYDLGEQKNKYETDKKVLQARVDAQQKDLQALEEQLKKEQSARSLTPLWVGLGAAGGIGLTLLTVFAVSRATK